MSQNSQKISKSVTLIPESGSVVSDKGELAYNSATDKIEAYIGAASANLVSHTHSGDTTFTGNHVQNGNETVTGTLSVSGAATIAGAATVNNNATVTGSLSVSGFETIGGALTVNNNATVTGALAVSGNETLAGSLTVGGAATINNALTVTGALAVSGNSVIAGTETISGALTVNNNATVTGALAVSGAATVAGAATLNNATVTGTLAVSGAANLASSVTANGPIVNKNYYAASGIATPAAPAAGYFSTYPKTDGKLYIQDSAGNERAIGADGGTINFVGANDRDAETANYSWATYNDSAELPVDLTGGTASALTFSRTNTAGEVLNGSYSYKIVKAASAAQGQGVSVTASVPPAYQGKDVTITIPFYVTSGSLVEGDIKVYIYDVTNSVLITPYNLNIVGKQGTLTAIFPTSALAGTPANQSIRLGIHFASTSASAVTIVFDDVMISPQVVQQGAIITDWQSYSLTVGATTTAPTKGSIFYELAKWRRVGDSMEIEYNLSMAGGGGAGSGTYLFPLPSGYVIDTTKIDVGSNARAIVGHGAMSDNPSINGTGSWDFELFAYNSTNLFIKFFRPTASTYFTAVTYDSTTAEMNFGNGSNHIITYKARVPISGWNSNISIGSSSTYRISSYLANGTRLTSGTPARLGEYRSYFKVASNTTATDEAPSTAPSADNGMRIYGNRVYTEAGISGQIGRYEIFVGKNKTIRTEFYGSAGRADSLDVDKFYATTLLRDVGADVMYDPVAGIVTVDATGWVYSTGTASRSLGRRFALAGGALTYYDDGYFDIIVSENALAVGIQSPRSEVQVNTGTAYGSVQGAIRKFSVVKKNVGSAITYVAGNSTDGDKFVINEDGVYSMHYSDSHGVTGMNFGLTLNETGVFGNDVMSAGVAPYLIITNFNMTGNTVNTTSATLNLRAGDVIRCHTDGSGQNGAAYNRFIITKVSN